VAAFLSEARDVSADHPAVISKFIVHAKEIDVDAVAQNGTVVVYAISAHVEEAGVHSGDATLILPARDLDGITVDRIQAATAKIAQALNVSGPMNIQFIAKNNEIKVIECNLRAARSFPFVSKTLNVNFAQIATQVLMGIPVEPVNIPLDQIKHVGCKVSVFSFSRLRGADPVLGVEMTSTGEVACFGRSKHDAYIKARWAAGTPPLDRTKAVYLSVGTFMGKMEFLPTARKLVQHSFKLFASHGTHTFLEEHGIASVCLDTLDFDTPGANSSSACAPSSEKLFLENNIGCAIIIPSGQRFKRPTSYKSTGYQQRRMAVDLTIPLINNIRNARMVADALDLVPDDIPVGYIDTRSTHTISLFPGLVDIGAFPLDPSHYASASSLALSSGFSLTFCALAANSITDMEKAHELVADAAVADFAPLLWAVPAASSPSLASVSKVTLAAVLALHDVRAEDWMRIAAATDAAHPLVVHAGSAELPSAVLLASLFDKHVHITDLPAAGVSLVQAAKEKGLRVTCDTTPFRLMMSADQVPSHLAPACSKSSKEQEALWEGVRSGVIDCLSVSSSQLSSSSAAGLDCYKLALPLVFRAVALGKLSLDQVKLLLYTRPCEIFHIVPPSDSFIEVDLDERFTLPELTSVELQGKIIRVVHHGDTAFSDGVLHSSVGSGRLQAMPTHRVSFPPVALAAKPKEGAESAAAAMKPSVPRDTTYDMSAQVLRNYAMHGTLAEREKARLSGAIPKLRHVSGVQYFDRAVMRYVFALASEMRVMMSHHMGNSDLLKGKSITFVAPVAGKTRYEIVPAVSYANSPRSLGPPPALLF
jgi:carbamoyl-phosphate synthase/aspartate carbamoyltransferase